MRWVGRSTAKAFEAGGALIGVLALVLQLYLLVRLHAGRGSGPAAATVEFFSYFTILSNLLAALTYLASLFGGSRGLVGFFARPGVKSAVALYIIVVGVVYAAVLRALWQPQGLAKLADVALHYVTPVLYVLYWLLFVEKGRLTYRNIPWWLIFPVIYAAYAIGQGTMTGFYPYPFIDLDKLGLLRVSLNIVVLVAGFGAVAAALVAVGRAMTRAERRAAA